VKKNSKTDYTSILRYSGSILIVIGYFILLHVNVSWGVALRLIANVMFLPWALKHKIWDFIAILSFFIGIEVVELIEIFQNFTNLNSYPVL